MEQHIHQETNDRQKHSQTRLNTHIIHYWCCSRLRSLCQQTDRWLWVFGLSWQRDGGDWGSEGTVAWLLLAFCLRIAGLHHESIHLTEPTICHKEKEWEYPLSLSAVTHRRLWRGRLLPHIYLAHECVTEWESEVSKKRDYWWDRIYLESNLAMMYSEKPPRKRRHVACFRAERARALRPSLS